MPKPKAKKPATHAVVNRRARFDYELGEEIVAGLVLTGAEVRAARDGHVQLKGAFVGLRNDELWLNNASFSLRLNVRGQAMVASSKLSSHWGGVKSVTTNARPSSVAIRIARRVGSFLVDKLLI